MDPGSLHSYHRFMWENLFSQLDIPPEQRAHPARRRAPRPGGRGVPPLRGGDPRRRRDRPSAARHRTHRAHRLQRARVGAGEPHPAHHPRPRDPEGRGGRLLRRGQRPPGGRHDGRRHHPRGPRDRDPRHRRAQGRTSCAARSRARWITRSRPPSCSATPTPRSTSTAPRPRRSPAIATPWLLGGGVDAATHGPGRLLAVPRGREGDPQADPTRLRRAPALVAGGARLARRPQRPGLQRARRQDPGPLEAAAGPADHLLLAPSRR